jgi:molybdate transport system substrate-binding protein
MKRRKAVALIAGVLPTVTLATEVIGQAETRTLTVAAAADLQFALPEIGELWQRANRESAIRTTFGSSGSLFAQIANGAPFDVFLSADVRYPRELVKLGKARADSLFYYGTGRLALWLPDTGRAGQGDEVRIGLKVLLSRTIRKIAIANPDHAPYGVAAVEALRHYGVYEAVSPRLVRGENATQAAQFVQSGGADAGLIPLSLALSAAMKAKGRYWVVPKEAHAAVEQAGVILESSRQLEPARGFCRYLGENEARAILERFGFEPAVRH